MKKFFTLLFVVVAFSMNAQTVLFQQNFEDGIDPMTLVDNDGLTPAANVADFSEAWTVANLGSGNGTNIAVSNSWYDPAGTADDWMITPSIEITAPGTIIRWEAKAQDGNFPDGYEVLVSTTGTELADFSNEVFSVSAENTDWTPHNVSLDDFVGESIHIAFRNNSTDQFLLYVDNISVVSLFDWDIRVENVEITPYGELNDVFPVIGTIVNGGLNTVTNFTLSWTDGVNDYSQEITGVNIPSLGSYDFTANDLYTIADFDIHDIVVTADSPNGNEDEDIENNSLSTRVTGLTFVPEKTIVFEEGTGTWCGWCPRGEVAVEYMEDTYGESFVGIAVHNGDPMVVSEYDNNIGLSGYPGSNVMRTHLGTDVGNATWEALHGIELERLTPVTVEQYVSLEPDERELTIEITATFAGSYDGDLRFNAVITEDGVTGTSSGYDQRNFYAGGQAGPMGGYEDLADPVPAADMVYNHVARAIIGGYFGTVGSIPEVNVHGESVTYAYTYTIPTNIDMDNIHIVSMVLEGETGVILNATDGDVDFVNGTNEVFNHDLAKVFPNPFSDVVNIRLNLETASDVNIRVMNSMGQLVAERDYDSIVGDMIIPFQAENLANGMYTIHLTIGDTLVTKKVMLQK